MNGAKVAQGLGELLHHGIVTGNDGHTQGLGIKVDGLVVGSSFLVQPRQLDDEEGGVAVVRVAVYGRTVSSDGGADILFLPIYYDPASLILTQANGMGYKHTFFGVDGMDGILGLEGFDTSLAEGVYLLTPFSADATDELTVNFVNKYKEKFGEVPNQFAADSYDCVYAIAQACEAAGVTADMSADEICAKLVEQFTSMTFRGLTGSEMTWNANGEVTKSPKAVVIQNGVYVGVEE